MSQETGRRDEQELLARTVDELMTDHCPPEVVAAAEGGWAETVWKRLAEAGLSAVGVPEERGGSGGSAEDAAAVVRLAAAHAAPVPLAEVLFPVAAVCSVAGLHLPDGPTTVAAGLSHRRRDGDLELSGTASRVPWARSSARVLVVSADDGGGTEFATWLDPSAFTLAEGDNLAGEPRDEVSVEGLRVADAVEVPAGTSELVRLQGALARSVQIAGALSGILDLSVRYAGERVQFGRPIAKFQAVANLLAELAGTAVAAEAAANAAVLAAPRPTSGAEPVVDATARMAVACAKTRTSAAAGVGARIAHQVHGAIGFTQEHRLHHLTRRLWSWREEYGSEEPWSAELGAMMIVDGAEDFWPAITRM